MKKKRIFSSFLIISLTALALIGCGKKNNTTSTTTTTTTTVDPGPAPTPTPPEPEPVKVTSNDCYVSSGFSGLIVNADIKESNLKTLNFVIEGEDGVVCYQIKPNIVNNKFISATVATTNYQDSDYFPELYFTINKGDAFTTLFTLEDKLIVNPYDKDSNPKVVYNFGIKITDDEIVFQLGEMSSNITVSGDLDHSYFSKCGDYDTDYDTQYGYKCKFVNDTLEVWDDDDENYKWTCAFKNDGIEYLKGNDKFAFEHIDNNIHFYAATKNNAGEYEMDGEIVLTIANNKLTTTDLVSDQGAIKYTYTYDIDDEDNERVQIDFSASQFSNWMYPLAVGPKTREVITFDKYHRPILKNSYREDGSEQPFEFIAFEYFTNGFIKQETYTKDDGCLYTNVYTYNEDNQITSITRNYIKDSHMYDNGTYLYEYDEYGYCIKYVEKCNDLIYKRIEKVDGDELSTYKYEHEQNMYDGDGHLLEKNFGTFYEFNATYTNVVTRYDYDTISHIEAINKSVYNLYNTNIILSTELTQYDDNEKITSIHRVEFDNDSQNYLKRKEYSFSIQNIDEQQEVTTEYKNDFAKNEIKEKSIITLTKNATTKEQISKTECCYYFVGDTLEYSNYDYYVWDASDRRTLAESYIYDNGIPYILESCSNTYLNDGEYDITKFLMFRYDNTNHSLITSGTKTDYKEKADETIEEQYYWIGGTDFLLSSIETNTTVGDDVHKTYVTKSYYENTNNLQSESTTESTNGDTNTFRQVTYDNNATPIITEEIYRQYVGSYLQSETTTTYDYDNDKVTVITYIDDVDPSSPTVGSLIQSNTIISTIAGEEISHRYEWYKNNINIAYKIEIYDYDDRFGGDKYTVTQYYDDNYRINYEDVVISETEKYKLIYSTSDIVYLEHKYIYQYDSNGLITSIKYFFYQDENQTLDTSKCVKELYEYNGDVLSIITVNKYISENNYKITNSYRKVKATKNSDEIDAFIEVSYSNDDEPVINKVDLIYITGADAYTICHLDSAYFNNPDVWSTINDTYYPTNEIRGGSPYEAKNRIDIENGHSID